MYFSTKLKNVKDSHCKRYLNLYTGVDGREEAVTLLTRDTLVVDKWDR